MLLAEARDLAALTGLPASDPKVGLALRRASGAFVDAVGWPVVVTTETIILRGDGGPELLLPARPVRAASVDVGAGLEVAGTGLDSEVLLDGRLGVLTRRGGWPVGPVLVTWEYGYTEIPAGISDAVLERAAHIVDDLGTATSVTVGPFSKTVAPAVAGGVTERWVQAVDRYRYGVGDRS